MNFSQRHGVTPVPQPLPVDSMPDDLRYSLWNALQFGVWDREGFRRSRFRGLDPDIIRFSRSLWFSFFKRPLSEIPEYPSAILAHIQQQFSKYPWNRVYEFLEAVFEIDEGAPAVIEGINHVLERELAAFRVVEKRFVRITSKEEVAALESALQDTRFGPVSAHLRAAMSLMSDRANPDYRNSIKESISAVESMAKTLAGDDKATLDDALRVLEKRQKLHPALKRGFSALYGYTSNADGIRHAMMEEPNVSADDAKFFLLSCTTFTNYLKTQA